MSMLDTCPTKSCSSVIAYSVPQPIGCGGQSNTTRANWQREDLANDNPSSRSPCAGEEENEDGYEGNLGVDSRNVVCDTLTSSIKMSMVETLGVTDDGSKELADKHA